MTLELKSDMIVKKFFLWHVLQAVKWQQNRVVSIFISYYILYNTKVFLVILCELGGSSYSICESIMAIACGAEGTV